MKIEDKAYFEMQPNLQGMKKVRDEIYALAQTHLRLSEKSADSQKQNYEYRIAAGLSSFVSRAPYAAEIGMEFKGSAYWNKKAIQLAKEGAALGVIADKLIAEALSIYNSHSKPIEDKRYFAISPAETEKKIRDLTAAWRKLMNVADNLHGMANPSPEIMKRQDQVDTDMERIGNQIAELKKSIGVQENVSVRLAKPVEDKTYFEKRIEVETWKSPKGTTYIAGLNQGSSGLFQPFITATYSDGGQQLMTGNPPKFKTEGGARKWLSAEITRRKTPNARQGSKVKMGFLSGTKKQQIDYVFGVGTNYGERAWKSGIKRLIDDKEALARIRLLKYELDPSSPMRNTVDKEFDKGWLKGYTSQQIQESENPPKFKKGDKVLYNTGTAKHIGTIEKVSPYAKPEAEYIVAFTTLSTGRSQLNIPESSISKSNASRTGTKSKFASNTNYAHKNTIKIKGKSDKIYALIYAEEGYGDNLTGFWNGHVQNNTNPKVNDIVTIGQFKSKEAAKAAAIKALKQEEQGTNFSKAKFANRGAFAEASSSPVLGSLLEKKVMPEGGWRAVETDGGALVIAFEDGDIAGNFARRAAENGYSATAPMAMAGRFWNVKVQNENKQ